jgi:hypothetical protein
MLNRLSTNTEIVKVVDNLMRMVEQHLNRAVELLRISPDCQLAQAPSCAQLRC